MLSYRERRKLNHLSFYKIGKEFKVARKSLGLSLEAVAEKFHLSPLIITKIKAGELDAHSSQQIFYLANCYDKVVEMRLKSDVCDLS